MIGDMNKSNGITLIALVVTIIVMLILASMSITTLIGDSGLFSRARDAKIEHDKAKYIEEIRDKIKSIVNQMFIVSSKSSY